MFGWHSGAHEHYQKDRFAANVLLSNCTLRMKYQISNELENKASMDQHTRQIAIGYCKFEIKSSFANVNPT